MAAKQRPEERVKSLRDGYGEFPKLPQIAETHSDDPPQRMFFDRNKPCPCGSGRNHKKCCGRHGTNLFKINQRRAKHGFNKIVRSEEYDNVMRAARVLAATGLTPATYQSPDQKNQFLQSRHNLSQKLCTAIV